MSEGEGEWKTKQYESGLQGIVREENLKGDCRRKTAILPDWAMTTLASTMVMCYGNFPLA